jgi:hypothetical protein
MTGKLGLSAMLLPVLWFLAVIGALGQILIAGQAWDVLVGLSGLAFIVELIWTLSRAKPAWADLPELDIFTRKRPGFWARTLLIFLGLF